MSKLLSCFSTLSACLCLHARMQALQKSKYGFLWITLLFFILSIVGHWVFAWLAYVDEQAEHNAPVEVSTYVVEVARDTLENWQSEFLQLIWQVAGLAYLLYLGSPQSKEGDERKEEKLDAILSAVNPHEASAILTSLEKKYPRG
jgi:threonine/homoserine/homoserine lactone efflux protein